MTNDIYDHVYEGLKAEQEQDMGPDYNDHEKEQPHQAFHRFQDSIRQLLVDHHILSEIHKAVSRTDPENALRLLDDARTSLQQAINADRVGRE